MVIPWQSLSDVALRGIVEEYVTREGTEYGAREYTLEQKVEEVLRALRDGSAQIVWDPAQESATLISVEGS